MERRPVMVPTRTTSGRRRFQPRQRLRFAVITLERLQAIGLSRTRGAGNAPTRD